MIPLDCFSCLDGLIWLGTQERVALKMHLAQSCLSRSAKHCREVIGLNLMKVGSEHHISSDPNLLKMERDVQQYYEWNAPKGLHIHGQCVVAG